MKAVSDLFAPVSGTVTEMNEALNTAPEQVNKDANKTWMIKVTLKDANEANSYCPPPITRNSLPKKADTRA